VKIFDGKSRRFIKRYLVVFEVMAIAVLLCMGYLFFEALTPAQGAGMFVDVVSGEIIAVPGKNTF
jgi:hypothetical protein